ncbi:MAG: helix-turn-helix domain-containing protein [Bdellovibrionales bacterium]|nr:helix-turn-helix domain-containing protein [Bdellovibrionales bacterium]
MKRKDPLATAQVNRRTRALRGVAGDAAVRPGWIAFMRRSLGMTLKQLAGRTGLSLPTVAQAERGEAAGRATLGTLRKMAHAMDCDLIYAFVPKADIDELMKRAAREKAKRTLATADVHMTLENQRVEQSIQERVERLANKLLEKGDVW